MEESLHTQEVCSRQLLGAVQNPNSHERSLKSEAGLYVCSDDREHKGFKWEGEAESLRQ